MASKGFRQFTIMQYEKNPRTGEDLHFDESNILHGMSYETIEKCSYGRHDKCVKTAETEGHASVLVGTPIPPHWHVCIKTKYAVEISTIAKWFNVAEQFVQHISGANAYIQCVEYLTHEHPEQQAKGKHLYPDSEIKSNHDWRAELDAFKARRAKKDGSKLNTKDYYRSEVMFHGKTLREVIDEDKDAYLADFATLEKCRMQYILKIAEMPKSRINYYIEGRGGLGKGLLSKALAKNLFPELKNDDDIYFEVGGSNVTLDGYDGQPVIIWNDFRAITLLHALGGRENVFNVFETHPTSRRDHIKHGYTRLTNKINIVNSVDPFTTFLDGLAGEYKERDGTLRRSEDKGQSYRRFPIIIPLHEEDFDILLNKGVLEGTNEYEQYVSHYHIRGNMEKIHRRLSAYEDVLHQVESKVVAPIIEAHNATKKSLIGGDVIDESLDDILNEFADYGEQDLEACKRDEEKKYEDFLNRQEYLINDALDFYRNYPEDPCYQEALKAQNLLRDNPRDYYAHEELHLKPNPFTGVYRY